MSKDLKPGWLVRSMDGAKNEIANCPNLQRLLVKSKADFGICLTLIPQKSPAFRQEDECDTES